MKEKAKRFGHPRFYEILEELAELHSEKNHDYSAGGDPLGNFYRVSDILALYPNLDLSDPAVITLVYLLKQLDAALWMKSNGHEGLVEGIPGRMRDVSVYALLIEILEEEQSGEVAPAGNERDEFTISIKELQQAQSIK